MVQTWNQKRLVLLLLIAVNALLDELVRLANVELAGSREEAREDRRETHEDRRERAEPMRRR